MSEQLEFQFIENSASPEAEARPVPNAAEPQPSAETTPPWEPLPDSTLDPAYPLERELTERTKMPVSIIITDNRTRMVTVNHREPGVLVRLHHMFLSAGPDVIEALAHWLKHPRSKKAGAVVDRFIRDNTHAIRPSSRSVKIRTNGKHHDLKELFTDINDQWFEGKVTASITWGSRARSNGKRRRSIKYGSYIETEDLIRIHPLLDQAFVPRYFIRYIVFHEMLHAFLGISQSSSGRRRVHTKAFKQWERTFPDYSRAVQWEQDPANLKRLLSPPR